jgi:quercetin dioxygenase-like cupin family protein
VIAERPVTVLELTLQPGAGAGPHTHSREDETIVVVAGRLRVDDGIAHDLVPGDAIHLPSSVRREFSNVAPEPLVAHVVCTPGGLERFFREVASAETDGEALAAAERAGLSFEW